MAYPRRVLITGASGLLGRALMKEFSSSSSFQVLGLAHSRISGNLKKVDLLDFEETRRVVDDFKPHFLIHSAAERRLNVVEKDDVSTKKLNLGTTEFLAKLVEGFNKGLDRPNHFLLYISTDYVFDGTKAPYKPDDQPNPLNKYGKSKLEGEEAVKRCHPNGLILRIPVLYGDVEYLGESAVTGT
jgi:S-adenosylmethionine synthetase